MTIWLGLSIYIALGYGFAILLFWLAARESELPEGSSVALLIMVLFWPLCLGWAMAYALGLMPEKEESCE